MAWSRLTPLLMACLLLNHVQLLNAASQLESTVSSQDTSTVIEAQPTPITPETKAEPVTSAKTTSAEPSPAPKASTESLPEPKASPEPTTLAEPSPGPKTSAEPSPEPKTSAEPSPEPITSAEPSPEPTTSAEPSPEPKTSAEPSPEPKTSAEPSPEPNTSAEPSPEPTTSAEPSPEPKTSAEPSPEPKTSAEPSPEPTTSAEPSPAPKTSAEPSPEPNTSAEPSPEPKTSAEPSPEPNTSAEPSPEPNTSAVPSPEPKTSAEPSPEPKTSAEPSPEPKTSAEPSPEPKTSAEPSPEPKTSAEPSPEPKTSAEPSPEPKNPKEPSPEPNSYYPFAEPVPNWKIAKKVWGAAWDFHIFFVGLMFSILGIYSLVSVFRLYKRNRLLSQRFFISLNAVIFLMCALRATYFMIDGYNSHETFVPIAVDYFLYTSGFPCLTSAFSILFLALLQTTKVQLLPSKVQKARYLVAIIIAHFSLSIITDLVVGFLSSARIMMFICQLVSILWGLFLFIGFFYIFRKLYRAAVRQQKEMMKLSLGKLRLPGINPIHKAPKLTLSLGVKVTFVTSVFGLIIAGLHIFAMIGVYGVFSTEKPKPWPWWILHFCLRLVELVMCFLMSYIATQPFRYQKRPKKSCCDYYVFAPCRAMCDKHDYATHEESIYWNDIHGVSVSYSPDRRLLNKSVNDRESTPLNYRNDPIEVTDSFLKQEEFKDVELGNGPLVLDANFLQNKNGGHTSFDSREPALDNNSYHGETADFDFQSPSSSTGLLGNSSVGFRERGYSETDKDSLDPLGVISEESKLKQQSPAVKLKTFFRGSKLSLKSASSLRSIHSGYSNLENEGNEELTNDRIASKVYLRSVSDEHCGTKIQSSPKLQHRFASEHDIVNTSIPEQDSDN